MHVNTDFLHEMDKTQIINFIAVDIAETLKNHISPTQDEIDKISITLNKYFSQYYFHLYQQEYIKNKEHAA